jgi:hypothetical protein
MPDIIDRKDAPGIIAALPVVIGPVSPPETERANVHVEIYAAINHDGMLLGMIAPVAACRTARIDLNRGGGSNENSEEHRQ